MNFKRFGLLMNVEKTEAMIMLGSKPIHKMSDEAYDRKITGVGLSYKEKQQSITKCEYCKDEVQLHSLKRHQLSKKCITERKKIHNNQTDMICLPVNNEESSNTIILSCNDNGPPTKCYYTNCKYSTNKGPLMRKHYRQRHPNDIIIINEEGLLPRCTKCGLFQKNAMSQQHQNSEDCKKFTMRMTKRRQEIMQQAAGNVEFYINGQAVKKVSKFKYLGRIITNDDNDLPAVDYNLCKARATWGRIGKIIKRKTNSNPKVLAIFYKVIIQSILLYGSESWVINNIMIERLNAFHRRCARFITGRHIRMLDDSTWVYPSTTKTLELADLLPIEDYVETRKLTVGGYVEGTDIYAACKEITTNRLVWWKISKRREKMNIVIEISENSESGVTPERDGNV